MALTKVTTGGITDATIVTADIAADAVTGAKIADDAVGAEHIEQLDADLSFADDAKAKFGAGNDLQLYHTGNHSYVEDAGTGELRITSNSNIWIEHGTENMIVCNGDGSVELYHDNVKKVETTANGALIDSGSDVSMDSNGSGQLNINGNGYTGGIALDGTAMNIYHNSGVRSIIFGINESEKVRLDASGNVNIGIASQFDSNKVNILGTKAYSSGIPQQQLNVADAQAYSTTDNGGSIGFSAKYNSGGAYTTMASIEGVKHNNIDGNYQGALTFKTRNNNGDNIIRMRLTDNGLCFGTDTAGANALDDYEEGTWTPVPNLTYNPSGRSITIGSSSGTYTKVGRMVLVEYLVQWTAISGSGSYNVGCSGLPFAAEGTQTVVCGCGRSNSSGRTFVAESVQNNEINVFRQYDNGGPNENDSISGFAIYHST